MNKWLEKFHGDKNYSLLNQVLLNSKRSLPPNYQQLLVQSMRQTFQEFQPLPPKRNRETIKKMNKRTLQLFFENQKKEPARTTPLSQLNQPGFRAQFSKREMSTLREPMMPFHPDFSHQNGMASFPMPHSTPPNRSLPPVIPPRRGTREMLPPPEKKKNLEMKLPEIYPAEDPTKKFEQMMAERKKESVLLAQQQPSKEQLGQLVKQIKNPQPLNNSVQHPASELKGIASEKKAEFPFVPQSSFFDQKLPPIPESLQREPSPLSVRNEKQEEIYWTLSSLERNYLTDPNPFDFSIGVEDSGVEEKVFGKVIYKNKKRPFPVEQKGQLVCQDLTLNSKQSDSPYYWLCLEGLRHKNHSKGRYVPKNALTRLRVMPGQEGLLLAPHLLERSSALYSGNSFRIRLTDSLGTPCQVEDGGMITSIRTKGQRLVIKHTGKRVFEEEIVFVRSLFDFEAIEFYPCVRVRDLELKGGLLTGSCYLSKEKDLPVDRISKKKEKDSFPLDLFFLRPGDFLFMNYTFRKRRKSAWFPITKINRDQFTVEFGGTIPESILRFGFCRKNGYGYESEEKDSLTRREGIKCVARGAQGTFEIEKRSYDNKNSYFFLHAKHQNYITFRLTPE